MSDDILRSNNFWFIFENLFEKLLDSVIWRESSSVSIFL